jgi:lipase
MRLHVYEWGDPSAPPLVCLHGVTSHGGRFVGLAERLSGQHRVIAPDLRGHGYSGYEPPWSIDAHLEDLLETIDAEQAVWLGHSYGGRLVAELAAREPDRVERVILLDPALQVLPHVAFDQAENERKDASYVSVDEAVAVRYDTGRVLLADRAVVEAADGIHMERGPDGRLRYRYCKSAVVSAWSDMSTPPPDPARVATLIVLGEQSWLMLDEQVDAYVAALGELVEVVKVPGGHTVYWDAFDETVAALETFLG